MADLLPVPNPERGPVPITDLDRLPERALEWLASDPPAEEVLSKWSDVLVLSKWLAKKRVTSGAAERTARLLDVAVGQLLGEPKPGGWNSRMSSLGEDIKIHDKVRAELRLLAAHPELVHSAMDAVAVPSRSTVLKAVRRTLDVAAAADPATVTQSTDGAVDVRAGDFRQVLEDIEPGTVDLVFTDPPYPQEFLPLWSDLSEHAARWLKPGGLVVAYTGQMFLPEVMARLGEHLDYWWCASVVHDTAHFRLMARRMQVGWKPVLIYRNGNGPMPSWVTDCCTDGRREKSGHDWQQAEGEAAFWLQQLTAPGDLVVDPFAGSGTTAAVASRLGRAVITCDTDRAAVAATTKRLTA